MQEGAQLHWRAEQPTEWLAAGVLEDEDGAALVAVTPDRPNGPSRIELAGQRIFVLETRQGGGGDILARRSHNEHIGRDPVRRDGMRGSIQDELSVLMQRLERAVGKINLESALKLVGALLASASRRSDALTQVGTRVRRQITNHAAFPAARDRSIRGCMRSNSRWQRHSLHKPRGIEPHQRPPA